MQGRRGRRQEGVGEQEERTKVTGKGDEVGGKVEWQEYVQGERTCQKGI